MVATNQSPSSPALVSDLKSQVLIRIILDSVIEVFRAGNIPVDFDIIKDFTFEDLKQRDALHKNKCILLGVMVPEKGVKAKYNDNHKFYKHLDLFANINLCFSHPSITTKHNNVDIAVIRENTEG
jgi:isocitrate dehydrogenase (NAD+)